MLAPLKFQSKIAWKMLVYLYLKSACFIFELTSWTDRKRDGWTTLTLEVLHCWKPQIEYNVISYLAVQCDWFIPGNNHVQRMLQYCWRFCGQDLGPGQGHGQHCGGCVHVDWGPGQAEDDQMVAACLQTHQDRTCNNSVICQ